MGRYAVMVLKACMWLHISVQY